MERHFERHFFSAAPDIFFQQHQFRSLDSGSVRIKGEIALYLSSYHDNKCLHLASEKFVYASESNLSLATGP